MNLFRRSSVIPDLSSEKDRDLSQKYFDRVIRYLVTNYSATELAGAYINAMSGVFFKQLMGTCRDNDIGAENCRNAGLPEKKKSRIMRQFWNDQ